jgi:hypothetical protein
MDSAPHFFAGAAAGGAFGGTADEVFACAADDIAQSRRVPEKLSNNMS